MLVANQAMVDVAFAMLGNTIHWLRDEPFINANRAQLSLVSTQFYQGNVVLMQASFSSFGNRAGQQSTLNFFQQEGLQERKLPCNIPFRHISQQNLRLQPVDS